MVRITVRTLAKAKNVKVETPPLIKVLGKKTVNVRTIAKAKGITIKTPPLAKVWGKKDIKSAYMAYYRNKNGGIVYKKKQGRTSEKDPILRRLNTYYRNNPEQAVRVKYIYSEKSRVIRPTDSLLAVKTDTGLKGWLTESGKFISEDRFRELLHNVDQTSPAATTDVSLLDAWDSLTKSEKAELVDAMQDFDWDVFWEEIGSNDPDGDLRTATKAYYDLIETIGDILEW